MQKNNHAYAALALALLLLFSFSHARVLINNPSYGQQLEILVENEQAPAEAILVAPDGQRIIVPFEGSQLRYRLQQTGIWKIEVGSRKYSLTVSSPAQSNSVSGSLIQPEFELPIYLAIATFVGLALSAVAIYFLFMRPPKQIPPMLEKKREGEVVRIRLSAGTLPLSEIMLEDEVGRGFKDGPKRMARARLEAGQVMELSYAWAGQLGGVSVRFLMDELPFEMKVSEGVVMLKESDALEEGDEIGASASSSPASAFSSPAPSSAQKKSQPHTGRKLSRRKE